jgi:hypothetical protein
MTIVGEVQRLGRAVECGEMTEQEAVAQLLQVAQIQPGPAAEMIRDWRGAVAQYEEAGRLMVRVTAEGAARQQQGEGQQR